MFCKIFWQKLKNNTIYLGIFYIIIIQESERFEISQSALIVNEDKLLILQLPNKKWVFVWWKINKNENYIDNISVWKQKATWNITFPLFHELKDLWFWVDDFLNFKKIL